MRYSYGTNDSYTTNSRSVSVPQLASIIKRDVEYGKWNIYEGGEADSITAHCRYQRKGFAFHSHLLIILNYFDFQQYLENIHVHSPKKHFFIHFPLKYLIFLKGKHIKKNRYE